MLTINLVLAWIWMLLGFLTGLVLGLFFHKPDWLGGYGSHPRRMYRLGHISFFGLGMVNLCFWLTAHSLELNGPWIGAASVAFLVGAVTMPLCCALMAHFAWARNLFALPVLSLVLAGSITVREILP